MRYKIFIERKAEKDLNKIPKEIREKFIGIILRLKDNPRPLNVRKLASSTSYYRIKIGDYRLVYEIKDKRKEICVFRIRHRKDAYLNL